VHKILPKAKSLPESEIALFKDAIQQPFQRLASMSNSGNMPGAE
jgi:hypothetical protein